jgi:hypothetical protein
VRLTSSPAAPRQHGRELAQCVGGVADAVEGSLKVRDAVALLHLSGERDHRLTTHHHVDSRPVGAGDVVIAPVAGDRGENTNAEPIEQRPDLPQLAGDVVFANQVDVVRGGGLRLSCADHVIQQRLAGELVAEILGAGEAWRHDRDHGCGEALGGSGTDRIHIVANQRRHAGHVDEHRRRSMALDDLLDRVKQLLLAAVDHVQLGHISRHAEAIELRAAGERVSAVPAVALAGDRPVHQVRRIGDRLQRDLGAVECAAASGRSGRQAPGGAAELPLLL